MVSVSTSFLWLVVSSCLGWVCVHLVWKGGAPPPAPAWSSGCTFPEVELPGGQSSQAGPEIRVRASSPPTRLLSTTAWRPQASEPRRSGRRATSSSHAPYQSPKASIGLRAPTTWYMPHEFPGVFHALLHHGRGFGHTDLEEAAVAVGHRHLGGSWFRPDKVKAVSPFARMLQSTYSDLSSVDLDLPERLLVGLGYAATSPDSPLDFRQAQSAAERSSPHCWSLMLPTSARVAQEVYEPLIGIQHPMLCSRLGDTWQIGATSIREDQLIASGLRFVQWCHASPNVEARKDPKNSRIRCGCIST